MAAVGDIIRGIFTGDEQPEDEVEDHLGRVWPIILPHVTHLSVHDSISVIQRHALRCHPNLVELICHDGVIKIESCAFYNCPRLKRLIIPGVEEIELCAFRGCEAVEHVEFKKLEIIRGYAFLFCKSLASIDLSSAKFAKRGAFTGCEALRDVKFGEHLDSLGRLAFEDCPSLERITIPLKNGLIHHDNVFTGCTLLNRVDLVEAAILKETMAAMLMEEWRLDMRNVINSINHILPNTPAGMTIDGNVGGKTRAVREWVELVLRSIHRYKAQHRSLLNEAAAILQLDLPSDIVHNNVLAFFELPLYTFDGEDAIVEQR